MIAFAPYEQVPARLPKEPISVDLTRTDHELFKAWLSWCGILLVCGGPRPLTGRMWIFGTMLLRQNC